MAAAHFSRNDRVSKFDTMAIVHFSHYDRVSKFDTYTYTEL